MKAATHSARRLFLLVRLLMSTEQMARFRRRLRYCEMKTIMEIRDFISWGARFLTLGVLLFASGEVQASTEVSAARLMR